MKTNVIMISSDRELLGVKIRQETKTGFLNLSDLQLIYNQQCEIQGWFNKRIDYIITQNKENLDRIYYLLKEQGIIDVVKATFMSRIENEGGIYKYLKKIKVYKTTGARHTKTIWCNPYLWMLIALELHPEIYAKSIIWLTDNLIINRIEAGNMYKGLTDAIQKFDNVDYRKLAIALNYIIFGRHETGIRNTGSQRELKELENLERNMAFSIERGFIKSFDELIDELRAIYSEEHQYKLKNI